MQSRHHSNTPYMEASNNTSNGYPKTNAAVFFAFLTYIIYIYLEVGYRIPFLGEIRFQMILGALLVLTALPIQLSKKEKAKSGIFGWTALLIFLMTLMTFLSADVSHSSTVYFDRVIKFSMFALMIAAFVNNPRELKWFIAAFLLACMKMGQEGFVGTITGSMIWENQGIPRLWGSTPIYFHPNSYSGMAVGTLPFVLYMYPLVSKWFKLALLALAALAANIIIFTGSRTGYVAVAFGVGLIIKRSKNSWKTLFWIAAISIALIPAIPHDYLDRFDSIFTLHEKEGKSSETRIQIIKDAWEVFKENPLGIGVGAFPIVRSQKFGRSQDTHNLYLEVATNLGIQGLITFLGFIYVLQKSLNTLQSNIETQIKRLKEVMDRENANDNPTYLEHVADLKWMNATAQAVYMFIFLRLVLGLFGMDLYEIYWWFALGLTAALLNMELHARKRTELLTAKLQA